MTNNQKDNFYYYETLMNREATLLDAFIIYLNAKALDFNIMTFTDDMNEKFTKILNKCIEYKTRGLYYDYEKDVNAVFENYKVAKKLVLSAHK